MSIANCMNAFVHSGLRGSSPPNGVSKHFVNTSLTFSVEKELLPTDANTDRKTNAFSMVMACNIIQLHVFFFFLYII